MSGWIGVDLDGTLAEYGGWKGPYHIGAPVEKMLQRVKRWIAEGRDVRIFTARVSPDNPGAEASRDAIASWCRDYIGCALPVTATKDFGMIELWDDRCVQIIPNTGRRADGND